MKIEIEELRSMDNCDLVCLFYDMCTECYDTECKLKNLLIKK